MREKSSLFFCLASIAMICSTGGFAQTLKGKIALELSADKGVYVWGENIWLDVTRVNLLDQEVVVSGEHHIGIRVTDDSGGRVLPGWIVDYYAIRYSVSPRSSLTESFRVDHRNDTTEESPGTRLLPGAYTVWAVLGDVTSNTLQVRVIPPSAEERVVAQQVVEKLHKWSSMTEAIQDAKNMIRQYPHTVYLPNVYLELIGKLAAADKGTARAEELVKYSLELIEKFPSHGDVQVALGYYVTGFLRKLGVGNRQTPSPQQWRTVETELQEILSRHPNERMKRYVDQIVKNSQVR